MIYDISMDIFPEMTVYKNRKEKMPKFRQSSSFEKDGVYETELTLNLHTGTHIDYPLHTLKDGLNSNTENLDVLIGKAKVFDLSRVDQAIEVEDIKDLGIERDDFVIFKTRNSSVDSFDFNFVYLAKSGAEYLKDKQIRGVGIDSLGIERNQPGHPTHDLLLSSNIIILEGLRLQAILEGEYELICLPLKIKDVEASLVRAILIK